MLPTSAIRIIEQSHSKLVIVDPPYYFLGGIFLLVGLLDLAFGTFLLPPTLRKSAMKIVGGIGLVGCLVGIGLLAPSTVVSFDRDRNTVVIEKKYFGLKVQAKELRLSLVQKVVVETTMNAKRLALLMESGETVMLDSYTSRDGHYSAAEAINNFLASTGSAPVGFHQSEH